VRVISKEKTLTLFYRTIVVYIKNVHLTEITKQKKIQHTKYKFGPIHTGEVLLAKRILSYPRTKHEQTTRFD